MVNGTTLSYFFEGSTRYQAFFLKFLGGKFLRTKYFQGLCTGTKYEAYRKLNWFWIMVLSFLNLLFIVNGSELLGLSYEKTNISKMKKDFINFSFENSLKFFFWQIFFSFCTKSFLIHKKMGEYNLAYRKLPLKNPGDMLSF